MRAQTNKRTQGTAMRAGSDGLNAVQASVRVCVGHQRTAGREGGMLESASSVGQSNGLFDNKYCNYPRRGG